RWQRVPPTERRGRVHTSTVTVAVLDATIDRTAELDPDDIELRVSRGSGPGGQHRNKTESCVTAVHKPTGLQVRIDLRSQYESKAMALKVLAAKLAESAKSTQNHEQN